MSSSEHTSLDQLVDRLERAAEQLRSGDLSPDAAPGDTPIPAEGAIDEAVETAKTFCGADAPGFVNGVLAAALRAQRKEQLQ